ncbi:MAG: hypothetical protein UT09_C0026G0005 [Parcubacteria group bacterium GW2011_GWF2_38_8]|nr:MAG: hypothetical protein UT09_C0026G0005 [Parcubacteria group bacterium GW2011_GWF2_38_8]
MSKISTNTCSACGTSVMNHRFLFVSNFIEGTMGKVGDKFFDLTERKGWREIASFVEKTLYTIFYLLGVLRYNSDAEKALTGRSKIIWKEAERRSISMEQMVVFKKHIEFYRAKINGKMFYFQSLPIPPWLHQSGYKWLDDKFILFEKLRKNTIPAPLAKKISTWRKAKNAFTELNKPIILKPQYGSRGRHTTTNINTMEELKNAFFLARQITPWMLMQEHLCGSICRATVIDNELVGFFKADFPKVTGHNSKTIRELIEERNDTRPERLSEILINDDLISFIKREGYALKSILPNGVTINLSAKTGRMYGSYTKEMLQEVHPKIHDIFKKAGKLVNAPVVGFDLIIEDPTKDPDTQHWGIIECNSLPFIDLHYFALEGTPINLAKNVWNLWSEQKVV